MADSNSPDSNIDWSRLYGYRREIQALFPAIWNVPRKKRPQQLVIEYLGQIDSVLEFGAGARKLSQQLRDRKPQLDYKSFDIDRNQPHDFYTLDDIKGEYDAVCMFEVIEHVRPSLALQMLQTAHSHLRPGGLLFVTTPNTFNPPEYLRDATHITPWCYDELGAIIKLADFNLAAMYRLYQDPLLTKLLRAYLFRPLFRLLGIDFCRQIIAVGQKN